jgi:hypothetical protein
MAEEAAKVQPGPTASRPVRFIVKLGALSSLAPSAVPRVISLHARVALYGSLLRHWLTYRSKLWGWCRWSGDHEQGRAGEHRRGEPAVGVRAAVVGHVRRRRLPEEGSEYGLEQEARRSYRSGS